MKLYSTNGKAEAVRIDQAILQGLAPDGGLYMPESIPKLSPAFVDALASHTLGEIAFEVAGLFLSEVIPDSKLSALTDEAVNFECPLTTLDTSTSVLELFHGPTYAFKDFGARFMARVMSYFRRDTNSELTILVATSGDTGGAVANGFFNVPGIQVVLLYPHGKVSPLQEQQLTTLGGNIEALEVDGTFDDCQRMVKEAFVDSDLKSRFELTSANSINIARLIPQSFYYLHAAAELQRRFNDKVKISFSVPSGNFGNLTAGLFASRYGLKVERFVASTNINDTFVRYLEQDRYEPKASVPTLSNAMDVGNPSNFVRLCELYRKDDPSIHEEILGASFDDDATKAMIVSCYEKFQYLICPHGAVGLLGVEKYRDTLPEDTQHVMLATAHPAKFPEVMDSVLPDKTEIPDGLKAVLSAEKKATAVSCEFSQLKDFLLTR